VDKAVQAAGLTGGLAMEKRLWFFNQMLDPPCFIFSAFLNADKHMLFYKRDAQY
jgi:hypothetical protein